MWIHWHRRDLRASDNTALAAAAGLHGDSPGEDDGGDLGGGQVLPAFVFDGAVLEHGSPPRVRYMLDALASLREDYRERDGGLALRRGDPAEELVELAETAGADGVVWNRDYSGLARERERAVTEACEAAGLATARHHDDLHHKPGSITTNAGDPYSVYSYFWKKWRDREKAAPRPTPDGEALVPPEDPGELPGISELGFEEPGATVPEAGTAAARERLESFCEDDVYRYEEGRDTPAEDRTSRLSAHLKWGTIGVRTVYEATEDAMGLAETEDDRESVEAFRGELAWREFYTHVLWFNPEVVTEDYREYEHDIEWRDDPEELAAWRRGETGYPIVDAGMRQLGEEAWMHNRVRMIVASFLTKDLMADWRHGYDHFREMLVDHNTANDNGGWQWAASTGTDAQPYFRIFNPMTQGERHDPDGTYVRRYVPELADASAEEIHGWHELSVADRRRIAPDYPDPIIDHSERREQALAMFQRARGEDGDGDGDENGD